MSVEMGWMDPGVWVLRGFAGVGLLGLMTGTLCGRAARSWAWAATFLTVLVSLPWCWTGEMPGGGLMDRMTSWVPTAGGLEPGIRRIGWVGALGMGMWRLAGVWRLALWCRGESGGPGARRWRRSWTEVGRGEAKGGVRVRFVRGLRTPAVWVWGGTWLLLPWEAMGWGKGTRGRVCAHELAHVRGGDTWLHGVWVLLDLVQWWNPVWWWLRGRLEIELEKCADREALRGDRGEALAYARELLECAQGSMRPAPAWTGSGGLEERVRALLGPSRSFEGWIRAGVLVQLLILGVLLLLILRGGFGTDALEGGTETWLRLTADPFPER